LGATILCSIRVPVTVTGVAHEYWGDRDYSYQTTDYAWSLIATYDPGAALDVGRYVFRMGGLFIVAAVLWFAAIPYRVRLKRIAWLLPLGLYAAAAIWRLLYVPCIWIVRDRYYARPVELDAETRALWDIGIAQVRYGLLFFEEFVLLVLVAACYGCIFAVFPHFRPRWKAASR
jgi:hypothetical protein